MGGEGSGEGQFQIWLSTPGTEYLFPPPQTEFLKIIV